MTERLTLHHVDSIKLVESLLTSNAAAIASHFSRVRPCATPQTAANQAPPSPGFSRQERWSGLPFPSPMHETEKWKSSGSVVSDSSRHHGLQPTRLLHPWDFPGKSTGVGCHCLLQHKERSFIYISYVAISVYPSFLNTLSSATRRWFSFLGKNKKFTVTSTFPSLPTICQAPFLKLWIRQYTEQIKDLVYILSFCLTQTLLF